MQNERLQLWFWNRIISPHMAELAEALASKGHQVFCVAMQPIPIERRQQGWVTPDVPNVSINWIENDKSVSRLINLADQNSIHFCEGLRANGKIKAAQNLLSNRGLKQYSVMETVNDSGLKGMIKRIVYSRIIKDKKNDLSGFLAIGNSTRDWLVQRGAPADKVHSFAYFLSDKFTHLKFPLKKRNDGKFKFIFVGQLVERKRLDWLINALGDMRERSFDLEVIGIGSDESKLKKLADLRIPGKASWLGSIKMEDVPALMSDADCLVLPSAHDGWGAVCSEALMVGTPVICSDACGASTVVKSSGVGGTFSKESRSDLRNLLIQTLELGCTTIDKRQRLKNWARSLGAEAGALYLLNIVNGSDSQLPPWQKL